MYTPTLTHLASFYKSLKVAYNNINNILSRKHNFNYDLGK